MWWKSLVVWRKVTCFVIEGHVFCDGRSHCCGGSSVLFLCSHGDRNKISACSGVRQIVCMIHHSDVLLMPYLLNQSKKKEKDNV